MGTQVDMDSSWENSYADAEKTFKTLFTKLALEASSRFELEKKLKDECDVRSLWQEVAMTKTKLLDAANATLARDKSLIEQERARLVEEITRLKKENESLSSSPTVSSSPEASFSVVLIDGDGLIFDTHHLQNGAEGGKEAALAFYQGLKEHVSVATSHVRTFIYMNKLGLSRALLEDKIVAPDEFDAFVRITSWNHEDTSDQLAMKSFQAAHTSTAVIDVGYGKEAADAKIRDAVSFYLGLHECKLVVLGASHDNGYSTMLRSLRTDGKMDRVQLLKGYENVAYELKEFGDSMYEIPGLFMTQRLGESKASPRSNSPVSPTKSSKPLSFSAAAQSPGSSGDKTDWQMVTGKTIKKAQITTIKDLKTRPCFSQYLRGECNRDDCWYGHDYDLSKNAMAELTKLAKKITCELWLQDMCPYTQETCILGHACPSGMLCPFNLRGKSCFFKKWHDEHASGSRTK